MKTEKQIVIHHSADFDGIFCREMARRFYSDNATYIGWDYGDPIPEIPEGAHITMLDISIDGLMGYPKLTWIDHHKTAIEKHGTNIPGYQIDGVSACRLAWQWFNHEYSPLNPYCHPCDWRLPEKEAFIARTVSEPWAVRLAGEYDIWDKRDPDAELFQHGLRSQEITPMHWDFILRPDFTGPDERNSFVSKLLEQGRAIQYAKTQENLDIISNFGFTFQWEGLVFLGCNHARFNSHLFADGIKPVHDGLFGFNWTGDEWRVSLYGVPGKPEIDLSAIAKKYGGGGHKQACGFKTNKLPFLT